MLQVYTNPPPPYCMTETKIYLSRPAVQRWGVNREIKTRNQGTETRQRKSRIPYKNLIKNIIRKGCQIKGIIYWFE